MSNLFCVCMSPLNVSFYQNVCVIGHDLPRRQIFLFPRLSCHALRARGLQGGRGGSRRQVCPRPRTARAWEEGRVGVGAGTGHRTPKSKVKTIGVGGVSLVLVYLCPGVLREHWKRNCVQGTLWYCEHSEFQTRTVRRCQRARKHFELQFVADVCPPFAGPYLFNFEVIFC